MILKSPIIIKIKNLITFMNFFGDLEAHFILFIVYYIFIFVGAGQGELMPSAMNLIYDFAKDKNKKRNSHYTPFFVFWLLMYFVWC